MSTDHCIIALFDCVDQIMHTIPKHPQARLYPSEIVTLALLFALTGVGPWAFDRWLRRNYAAWFPNQPDRTRVFRLVDAHDDWAEFFVAQPTILGVADSSGMELRHPWREDRADRQLGGKGLSNHRWIIGAKFAYVLNQQGVIVASSRRQNRCAPGPRAGSRCPCPPCSALPRHAAVCRPAQPARWTHL